MDQYTEGFRAGYAQAIGDADAELKRHGDDRTLRYCRRDVLALVKAEYNPEEVMPQPDWSGYSVPGVDQK